MIRQQWDALTRYLRTRHPNLARVGVAEGLAVAVVLWVWAIVAAMLVPLDRRTAWEAWRFVLGALSAPAAVLYLFAAARDMGSARGVSTRDLIKRAVAVALVALAISTAGLGGMLAFRVHATLALDAEDARVVNCEAWNRGRSDHAVWPPESLRRYVPSDTVCADVRTDPNYRFRTIHEVREPRDDTWAWRDRWLDAEKGSRAHAYAEAYVGHGFATTFRAPRIGDLFLRCIGGSLFLTALVVLATGVGPSWRRIQRRRGYLAVGRWFLALAILSVGALYGVRRVVGLGLGIDTFMLATMLLLLASILSLGASLRWTHRFALDRVIWISFTVVLTAPLVVGTVTADWMPLFEMDQARGFHVLLVATGLASFAYAIWLHRRVVSLPE